MSLFRTSIIGGLCLASLHSCWLALIFLGWAQPLMNLIFKLHMLTPPFQVQPFDAILALGLISITFLFGFFYGAIFFVIKRLIIK